jgi:hypothetical protein
MDNHQLSGGVDGMCVKVQDASVETLPSRPNRRERKATEVVEGEFGDGQEKVPAIGRERDVGSGENREEVVLGGSHRSLGFVGPVVLGGNVLELDGRGRLTEEVSEVLGPFVVQDQVPEGVREGSEERRSRFEGRDIGRCGAGLHGDEMNVVEMDNDEYIRVSQGRGDGKTTGEVGGRPFLARNCSGGGEKRGGDTIR